MRKNSKKLISKIHISVYSWIIITILDNEDFDLRNVEWNKYYSKQLVKMSIIKYICFFKCKKKKIGATILHDAAVKGRIQVIDWLIKHTHLNLNVKDTNGMIENKKIFGKAKKINYE